MQICRGGGRKLIKSDVNIVHLFIFRMFQIMESAFSCDIFKTFKSSFHWSSAIFNIWAGVGSVLFLRAQFVNAGNTSVAKYTPCITIF